MKKLLVVLLSLLLFVSFTGCSKEKTEETVTKISIACTEVPHSVILGKAKEILAKENIELEIKIFSDYVQPMNVVESGEIDANYFAHTPYVNNFNAENGTHLVPIGFVHYEPLGIYAGKVSSLSDLKDGDVIAVPNDTTNECRALLLLEANGIITLPEGTSLSSNITKNDIVSYKVNVEIKELEAAQVSRVIDEVAVCVINGNYALEAGVIDKCIVTESSESLAATTYVNVLCVKEGNEKNAAILRLVEVLEGSEIAQFITDTYGASVVPFQK